MTTDEVKELLRIRSTLFQCKTPALEAAFPATYEAVCDACNKIQATYNKNILKQVNIK